MSQNRPRFLLLHLRFAGRPEVTVGRMEGLALQMHAAAPSGAVLSSGFMPDIPDVWRWTAELIVTAMAALEDAAEELYPSASE